MQIFLLFQLYFHLSLVFFSFTDAESNSFTQALFFSVLLEPDPTVSPKPCFVSVLLGPNPTVGAIETHAYVAMEAVR